MSCIRGLFNVTPDLLSDHSGKNNKFTALNNFYLETVRNNTSILNTDINRNLLLLLRGINIT